MKVLVVDDDMIMRSNIQIMIDWETKGFSLCGEVSNGFQAIEEIKKKCPDIVITDMRMPIMDGVALIEHIRNNFPEISVIALSGYSDFEYVRNSMINGAVDYILKHQLNEQTLTNALNSAVKSIKKNKDANGNMQMLEMQSSEDSRELKEYFINQLVTAEYDDFDTVIKKIKLLNLNISIKNLVVVVAEVDDYTDIAKRYEKNKQRVLFHSFINILNEVVSDYYNATVSYIDRGRFVIIISNFESYGYYLPRQLKEVIDRCQLSINRYLNITVSFGISGMCKDLREIPEYYNDACKNLQNKFFRGRNNVSMDNGTKDIKGELMNLEIQEEKKIISFIKTNSSVELKDYITSLLNKYIERKANHNSFKMICIELINIANKELKNVGLDINLLYENSETPYTILDKYETVEDIKNWMIQIFIKLVKILNSYKTGNYHSQRIIKAIEFINKNYKKDISLTDMAECVNISEAHFSRIFKKECGIGFVDFLNNTRIEYVKQLLIIGELSLKRIAAECGFDNYNYFFKIFKDICGITPLEYQDKNEQVNR